MILVTVGTHSAGFNRLVKAADEYAGLTDERVVIQYGTSTNTPTQAECFQFTEFEHMKELYEESRIVVTHAAAGAILMGLQMEKPLVLVPRRKKFKEHFDDHQLELVGALTRNGQVVECDPVTADNLASAIRNISTQIVIPSGPAVLVKNLRQHLESLELSEVGD